MQRSIEYSFSIYFFNCYALYLIDCAIKDFISAGACACRVSSSYLTYKQWKDYDEMKL